MINEVIILAGGQGTRLKKILPDMPKSMAPVNGKPFISYVMDHLIRQNVSKFIFSLGYKHEMISEYIKTNYPKLDVRYVVEKEPLGTGGAIRFACNSVTEKNVMAINGDSFYKLNVKKLSEFHSKHGAECTVSLKPMKDFDRYGAVEIDAEGKIKKFREKQHYKSGLISSGFYAINVKEFLSHDFPEKFSIEKDYLEKYSAGGKMFGFVQDEYFIDIGIPEDYEKFKTEISRLK